MLNQAEHINWPEHDELGLDRIKTFQIKENILPQPQVDSFRTWEKTIRLPHDQNGLINILVKLMTFHHFLVIPPEIRVRAFYCVRVSNGRQLRGGVEGTGGQRVGPQ